MILNLSSWILTVDSRLRGNDGRFCKGPLMGEESKVRVTQNLSLRTWSATTAMDAGSDGTGLVDLKPSFIRK